MATAPPGARPGGQRRRVVLALVATSPLYLLFGFLAFVFFQEPEDVPLEPRLLSLHAPVVEVFSSARSPRVAARVAGGSRPVSRPPPRPTRALTPYDEDIELAASRHGVPSNLVRAVARVESAFNPRAVSYVGAQGLMQLMPATARDMKVQRAFDPSQNIDGGTRYLSVLSRQFSGDLVRIIAAYNAGPDAVRKYGGIPPYTETRLYVRRVLEEYDKYNGLNPLGSGADVFLVWPVDTPILEEPARPERQYVELAVGGGVVRAASEGLVAATVRESSGTWRVRVQHDGRFATVYRGLTDVSAMVGRTVEPGEPLGRISARTAKLRFEVLESERPRDPLEFQWEPHRERR